MITNLRIQKLLKNAVDNLDDDTSAWRKGLDQLTQSNVFQIIQELAKPEQVSPSTPNYVDAQAAEANRAIGVTQVLELLTNYLDFLNVASPQEKPATEYGGLNNLLESNDLTEEELYAIRNNTAVPKLTAVPITDGTRIPVPDFSAGASGADADATDDSDNISF